METQHGAERDNFIFLCSRDIMADRLLRVSHKKLCTQQKQRNDTNKLCVIVFLDDAHQRKINQLRHIKGVSQLLSLY
jgi:hypothetical protein